MPNKAISNPSRENRGGEVGLRPIVRALPGIQRPSQARSAADVAAAGRMLGILKAGGDMRSRKVRRTRAAIRSAKYHNDLKLEVAIDRLLNDLTEA